MPRPPHTVIERRGPAACECFELDDRLRSLAAAVRLLEFVPYGLRVVGPLFDEQDVVEEEPLEDVQSPLDGVVDPVRERLDRAQRDALLGRVQRRPVRLSHMRDHHLRVALGAECSALQQRLPVQDTPAVDVEPRLHVVEGVADARETLPEPLVEQVLRLSTHPMLIGLDPHLRVDRPRGLSSHVRLEAADVAFPEEQLPREVAPLDAVHVGQHHTTCVALPPAFAFALDLAADAHHCPSLEDLTADGAGAHEEEPQLLEVALVPLAEDGDLPVVAARLRLAVFLCGEGGREHLGRIDVQQLLQGREGASDAFEGFLPRHAPQQRRERRQLTSTRAGERLDDVLHTRVVK
mmetsp:Transcript_8017/g.22777  ORF Transcript_8017/g.22777 Transcript_8017/m.22777 type:complete len:350 (-) Transcript_8017:831-1880(-)